MKLKNKIILGIFVFFCLIIGHQSFASTTNGTIDLTYHYAWGENVGFIDFKNIVITDTSLSGSAYGENIGWIDLSTIVNNSEGALSGYAWGENIGWVDFSKTVIGTDGIFTGFAYGENIGFITFGTTTNKVLTDWRPKSTRPHGSSGGSYAYGCKDVNATNYDAFSISKPELCKYNTTIPVINSTEQILGSGKCSADLIITDNLKQGAINGKYNTYNKGIVKQVNILQSHINRILASSYKQASGPVDGIFGPLTKEGVKRLQTSLNTILKPTPLLVIDGIVGPFTKEAINNSCGN